MEELKVVIVDYGIGNLFSVSRACERVGIKAIITADRSEIKTADALILPGVGAFGDAMNNLKKFNLIDSIHSFAESGKYMMGVCLGMQLLMTESEEFGKQQGLGIIKGICKRFPNSSNEIKKIKVPQIMWNKIYAPTSLEFGEESPLNGFSEDEFMYFVHSYYVLPDEPSSVLSLTNYCGIEYCSSVKKNNIFAFQFHPEKSGEKGLTIYRNFKNLITNGRAEKY